MGIEINPLSRGRNRFREHAGGRAVSTRPACLITTDMFYTEASGL